MKSGEKVLQSWTLDSAETSIEFQVRHMVVTNVYGRFLKFKGSLNGDPEVPDGTSVLVEIDSNSIDTHDRMRDRNLRGKEMFDCDRYPAITFAASQIEHLEGKPYKVTGNMTIKEITKQVTLTGEMEPSGSGSFTFSLKGKVSSEDFGLRWKSFFDPARILVGSVVTLLVKGKFKAKH